MLKTSYISLSATPAKRWISANTGCGSIRRSISKPTAASTRVRFSRPSLVMLISALTPATVSRISIASRNVDVGRPQQLLAERGAELVEPVVDAEPAVGEERAARQRQAVAVDAAAAHADDDVAGARRPCRRSPCRGRRGRPPCRRGRSRCTMSLSCAVSPPEIETPAIRAPSHSPAPIASSIAASAWSIAM